MASHGPPRPSTTTAPSPLLQLPSEVLCIVWDALQTNPGYFETALTLVARVQHQHALRATCRQMRDATTPFLSALMMCVNYEEEEETPGWQDAVREARRQLAAFPAAATLTTLVWRYREVEIEEVGDDFYVRLPELLPTFLADVRGRLGDVEEVTLQGQLALGYGEISSLVDALPRLRSLSIESVCVFPRALAPLSRLLPGLRALSLECAEPPDAGDSDSAHSVYACLRHLSTLTSLHVDSTARTTAAHLLPHLSALPSLLHLDIGAYGHGDELEPIALDHLRRLTSLTSLRFRALLVPCSVLPNQLLRLNLSAHSLDTPDIRLLASFPRLSKLTALQAIPDTDLSGLACSYTKLTLRRCGSPLSLTRLPLGSVTLLNIGEHPRFDFYIGDDIAWSLDPAQDPAAASAVLRRACELLTLKCSTDPSLRFKLLLSWVNKPRSSSSSDAIAPLLAALSPLAPLGRRRPLTLAFGDGFDEVKAKHIEQLATHVPSLHCLHLMDASRASFPVLVSAVGTKLPRISVFNTGGKLSAGEFPRASQDALLAMAAFRITACLPLVIGLQGKGITGEQVAHYNTVLRQLRSGAGFDRTAKVCFEMFYG